MQSCAVTPTDDRCCRCQRRTCSSTTSYISVLMARCLAPRHLLSVCEGLGAGCNTTYIFSNDSRQLYTVYNKTRLAADVGAALRHLSLLSPRAIGGDHGSDIRVHLSQRATRPLRPRAMRVASGHVGSQTRYSAAHLSALAIPPPHRRTCYGHPRRHAELVVDSPLTIRPFPQGAHSPFSALACARCSRRAKRLGLACLGLARSHQASPRARH